MTVAVASPINSYVGAGSASTFSFTFPVFLSSEILVIVVNTSSGATSTLALGTDYTVTGLNAAGTPASTGSITLVSSGQVWLSAGNLATGYTLSIQANFPLSQPTSIRNQGDFDRGALEDALDNLEYQIQQIELAIGSLLSIPAGLLIASPGLPVIVNSGGTGLTVGAGSSVALPVSIAQGGTNSTTALNNNRVMKSSGGKIVETAAMTSGKMVVADANGIPVTGVTGDMSSTKITGLANGTASADAAAFGQVKVIQILQNTSNSNTSTSSSTLQGAGNQSVTITPTSASNRIKITVTTNGSTPNTSTSLVVSIKRGTTELSGLARGFLSVNAVNGTSVPISICYIDSPATTSPTTYQVFFASLDNTNTVTIGSTVSLSVIIAEEIV